MGGGGGEQVKIHRNNSNAWAEKYLVAFHLHFPFWVRQSESNISRNSLANMWSTEGDVEGGGTHLGQAQDAASQFVATNSVRSAWHL